MSRTITVRLTDGQAKALRVWLVGCLAWFPVMRSKRSDDATIAAMRKLVAALEGP